MAGWMVTKVHQNLPEAGSDVTAQRRAARKFRRRDTPKCPDITPNSGLDKQISSSHSFAEEDVYEEDEDLGREDVHLAQAGSEGYAESVARVQAYCSERMSSVCLRETPEECSRPLSRGSIKKLLKHTTQAGMPSSSYDINDAQKVMLNERNKDNSTAADSSPKHGHEKLSRLCGQRSSMDQDTPTQGVVQGQGATSGSLRQPGAHIQRSGQGSGTIRGSPRPGHDGITRRVTYSGTTQIIGEDDSDYACAKSLPSSIHQSIDEEPGRHLGAASSDQKRPSGRPHGGTAIRRRDTPKAMDTKTQRGFIKQLRTSADSIEEEKGTKSMKPISNTQDVRDQNNKSRSIIKTTPSTKNASTLCSVLKQSIYKTTGKCSETASHGSQTTTTASSMQKQTESGETTSKAKTGSTSSGSEVTQDPDTGAYRISRQRPLSSGSRKKLLKKQEPEAVVKVDTTYAVRYLTDPSPTPRHDHT